MNLISCVVHKQCQFSRETHFTKSTLQGFPKLFVTPLRYHND